MPLDAANEVNLRNRWRNYMGRRTKKALDNYFDEIERLMWPEWVDHGVRGNWGPEIEWDNYRRKFGQRA
jgi:hypothetical protein